MGQKKKKTYVNLAGSSSVTGKKRRLAKSKSRRANAAGKAKSRGSARSSR